MEEGEWRKDISHDKLQRRLTIRGGSEASVELQAEMIIKLWDHEWNSRQELDQRILESHTSRYGRDMAAWQTSDAESAIAELESILTDGLGRGSIRFTLMEDRSTFNELPLPKPLQLPVPPRPDPSADVYRPQLGRLDRMIPARRTARMKEAQDRLRDDLQQWEHNREMVIQRNAESMTTYDTAVAEVQKRSAEFTARHEQQHEKVLVLMKLTCSGTVEGVLANTNLVLTGSTYPRYFPKTWDLCYVAESKVLEVDYDLPDIAPMPHLKQVKYNASKNSLVEQMLPLSKVEGLYDNALYMTALRTVYELFRHDPGFALDAIVFNGWVKSMDPSTGKQVNACILSVQARRSEFLERDLHNVDPKACFKRLKGVGSAKLSGLAPVRPVLHLNKEDARFIDARAIEGTIDSSTNLASMDWQDFEHLVRELFAEEFGSNGGEVKVTRASRDYGVDAIAFDPDPIRGGKIVIQAKRYTRPVDVSAVRDLYGTVVNEGANSGILVTTADFGAESYEFAKGKPLKLVSGGELLGLLEKHGHHARIDIAEARAQLAGEQR